MINILKVRLYQDENQKILLEEHFGYWRSVWNHFFDVSNKYYSDNRNNKDGLTGLMRLNCRRQSQSPQARCFRSIQNKGPRGVFRPGENPETKYWRKGDNGGKIIKIEDFSFFYEGIGNISGR